MSLNLYNVGVMHPSQPSVRIVALVPSAGVGVRAQAASSVLPKQYRLLGGVPMLRLAVQALLADARIEQVRVITAPEDLWAEASLAGLPRTVCRPCGGETRAQTVLNGLQDAGLSAQDWVLVHDAARPGLPLEALARLLQACLPEPVGGLLALPVGDTVKQAQTPAQSQAAQASTVQRTLAREGLWLAQTPQMFRARLLEQALVQALEQGLAITDEASALEALGHAPLLIQGSVRNAKVTWPEDFDWVQSWLATSS